MSGLTGGRGSGVMMRSKFKQLRKLREVEEGREIYLAEIADSTGVNINTLSRWDQAKVFKLLDGEVAYALCQYFGVTLNELVEFVPPASA